MPQTRTGAASVVKAVDIKKPEIKCACVGDSNVPLGFVPLTENVFVIGLRLRASKPTLL